MAEQRSHVAWFEELGRADVGRVEHRSYRIRSKGRTLVTGLSIGEAVVAGRVCLIESARDIHRFVDGAVLVTQNTDPDWDPF